jgi:hypothetical protein
MNAPPNGAATSGTEVLTLDFAIFLKSRSCVAHGRGGFSAPTGVEKWNVVSSSRRSRLSLNSIGSISDFL